MGAGRSPLDLLCACLVAGERGAALDDGAAAAFADGSVDFVRLAGLAGRHLVTPMLAACFARPELARAAPEDFRLYVGFIHAENRRRNAALASGLAAAAASLNAIGIEPVLLKGAIRLADGLYPDPGWRFMRDLDLLTPRDQAAAAAAELQRQGYAVTAEASDWPARHRHLPALVREDDGLVIELHLELLSAHRDLCPAEEVLARAQPVDFAGARVRLPAREDQLAHLIAHDRLDRELRPSGSFLLRSLFEAALLCRDGASADRILARFAACGLRGWAGAHLRLAGTLFPEICAPPRPSWPDRARAETALALERLDADWTLRAALLRVRRFARSLAPVRRPGAWAVR